MLINKVEVVVEVLRMTWKATNKSTRKRYLIEKPDDEYQRGGKRQLNALVTTEETKYISLAKLNDRAAASGNRTLLS